MKPKRIVDLILGSALDSRCVTPHPAELPRWGGMGVENRDSPPHLSPSIRLCRCEGGPGFTLIETIIAVSLITVGLFGVMSLFYNTVGSSLNSHLTVMASSLGREQLEKMVFEKKMRGFDYIDPANYPATQTFSGSFAPFTRTVGIQGVDKADLTTPRVNSDYKRMTVTVTWTGGNFVRLETLVTRWGEAA